MFKGVPPNPDSSFVRALKDFDPKLRVQFDRKSEKFYITKRRAVGGDAVVLVVQTDDRKFRQPDQRDIKALYHGDLWRHGGVKERIRRGEQRAIDQQVREEKNVKDELRAATREDKIQLSNTYRKAFNEGSKSPEFRRVEVQNRRALTAEQIRNARAAGRDPWAQAA